MNENLAFYLKYRPQRLSEIIGQDPVKEILSKTVAGNRLSHAYLFVGPRGTGKTSTARILAKMVNCEGKGESGKGEVPCNKCASCISITDGSNLDLIEIDAASNRGIEDIRSLREKIKLTPTSSKKKVYIIDEVHMLTSEAFNALLKTLEEPPAHALFILATTEIAKVPQTILSRCLRLDFTLADAKQLKEALEKIIKLEKIDIDEEALAVLIKKADGSFRDGVKLLDQLSSKQKKITKTDVLENFRSLDFENVLALVENLVEKNAKKALMEIQKMAGNGIDIKEVILSLMDIFREMVFIKNDLGEELVKVKYTTDKYEKLNIISQKFEGKAIAGNLNILQKAVEQLKFTSIPSLPLELAVVEICGEQQSEMLDDRNLKPAIEVESSKIEIKEDPPPDDFQTSIIQPQNLDSSIQAPASKSGEIINSEDISKLKEKWTYILETSRSYNFSLEALLRSVRIADCTDTVVIMEVPYSFHQRILEAPKNRDFLEGVLSEVLGRTVRVSCTLGNRPVKKEDVENVEVAQDDEIIRVAAEIFNSDSVN